MKKLCVLLLCVLLLALTSCSLHIDTSPWPASVGYIPANEAQPTPAVTDQPQSTDAIPQLSVTPTPPPSQEEPKPGFNG